MNRISRKAAALGAAGVLGLAGIVGVAGHNAAHAATPMAITQPAADPDTVQQQVQSGSQQDVGGADTAEAGAPATPDTDTIQSQSQTDTP